MKKPILLLAFCCFIFGYKAQVSFSFAQKNQTLRNKKNIQYYNNTPVKTGEEVIWWEDFNGGLPEGWTIVDSSGYDMPWIWTTDSIYGAYAHGYINSETAENGFIAMNADGYNTVPQFDPDGELADTLIDVDSYIQTSPIDLTNYTNGVIIQFHQQYVSFWGMHFYLEISNDYNPQNPDEANWIYYTCNWEESSGESTIDKTMKFELLGDYITQGALTLRFHAFNSTHHYWCVDDIKISELLHNNLVNLQTLNLYEWDTIFFEHNILYGGLFYQIPKNQTQAFVGFISYVKNESTNEQINAKLKTEIIYTPLLNSNDSVVFQSFSEQNNIPPFHIDTLESFVNYIPDKLGYYTIQHTIEMDSTDEYPEDNTDSFHFIVNDSTYSRVSDSITSSIATRNYIGGGNDGNGIGVMFSIHNSTEVEGIRWYFSKKNAQFFELINQGSFKYTCKLFAATSCDSVYHFCDWQTTPIISSLEYTIELSDTGKWIFTPFEKNGSSEFLEQGSYLAFIETGTGVGTGEDYPVGFYIGEDLSIPQPTRGIAFLWVDNSWGWIKRNPSIQLIIAAENWTGNDGVGVEETKNSNAKGLILHQNYPNPASAKTVIKYSNDKSENIDFKVYEITGKLVFVKKSENVPAGTHVINLDISNINSGIYYYTIKTNQTEVTKKMVVIK
ncbi:MAG: T9SS type A sorting domain-containing protein [Chlorobi bacterium]|nr:T9SS type A sorting domain-containing protein [Chlorobiota bacterium]